MDLGLLVKKNKRTGEEIGQKEKSINFALLRGEQGEY